jgi:hypothetical protein
VVNALLPSDGEYSLALVNVLGERIVLDSWRKTTPEAEVVERRFALRGAGSALHGAGSANLPNGAYLLVFTTPTERATRVVQVQR